MGGPSRDGGAEDIDWHLLRETNSRTVSVCRTPLKARWDELDWRCDMSESGMEKLHSLLFKRGRELVNLKFLPGTGRGLTANQLGEAAADALQSALNGDLVDCPPMSGRKKTSLMDAF